MDCYNDKHKMPLMDSITERLTWYAENYGRANEALIRVEEKVAAASRDASKFAAELSDARYELSRWKTRAQEAEALVTNLEKKMPKKPAKKVAKKVKK